MDRSDASVRGLSCALLLLALGACEPDPPKERSLDAATSDHTQVLDAIDPDVPRDAARDVTPDVTPDVAPDVARVSGTCALPRRVFALPAATPQRASGETRGASLVAASSCEPAAAGPEDVLRVDVARRVGVVFDTEDTATTFDTVLSLRRVCADRASELACDDDGGRGATSRLRAVLDPGAWTVVVDGPAGAAGAYELTARSFDPAPNATCDAALALAPGATLTAHSLAGAGGVPGACRPDALGGALYYRVTVPATSVVTVRATPIAGAARALVLRALDACGATTCAATSAGEVVGAPTEVTLRNATASPRAMLVAVSSTEDVDARFDLAASAPAGLVPGARCDAPLALSASAPLRGLELRGATMSGAARCLPTVTSGEVYLSLRVPPATRATVRATLVGASPGAVALRAFAGCSAASCDEAVAGDPGAPAVLVLQNGRDVARDVVLSAAIASGAPGAVDVAVTTEALTGYRVTRIAASCDDVPAAAAVTPAGGGAWEDDEATAVAALPFPVRYFGADVGRWSASANGFVQMHGALDGAAGTTYRNVPLPSRDAPDGVVAAFWDDLAPSDAPSASVRAATVGAAPSRRFVVQWTDWAFATLGSARLTFQVKLFEGTHVVEVHHCALAPAANDRVRGAGATVGVESLDGANGTTAAHDTAGAVTAGGAFRFSP